MPEKWNLEKDRAFLKKGHEVYVTKYPKCDFCDEEARYDGKTRMGPWGNMCEAHFRQYGVGLGVGKGQKLVLKPEVTPHPSGKTFEDWMKDVDSAVGSVVGVGVYDLPDQPYRDYYDSGMSAKEVARMAVEEQGSHSSDRSLEEMRADVRLFSQSEAILLLKWLDTVDTFAVPAEVIERLKKLVRLWAEP